MNVNATRAWLISIHAVRFYRSRDEDVKTTFERTSRPMKKKKTLQMTKKRRRNNYNVDETSALQQK